MVDLCRISNLAVPDCLMHLDSLNPPPSLGLLNYKCPWWSVAIGQRSMRSTQVLSSINYLGHLRLGLNNVLNFVLTVIIMLTSRRESLRSVLSALFTGLMVLG